MLKHLDYDDPKYRRAAAEILRRHDKFDPEANITAAVRDFLILTGLARSDDIALEQHPALGSRQAVDLAALDTFMEFKRRIGSTGGMDPNPDYVRQLDDYLEQSNKAKSVRMGVLTDGRHWLLRWPNAGPVKSTAPYAFTLDNPDRWFNLYEWLRDNALTAETDVLPDRKAIADRFGPSSPQYERDIASLKALYHRNRNVNTIRVKTQLWKNLLMAALGEVASTDEDMDDLFVRHTYLTAVIGMVVQARFGIDIRERAEIDSADLLLGRDFYSKTSLQGVVESDFFAWPTEVQGGRPFIRTLARRLARFDWQQAPNDVASILYETVIPPDERRQLGEYYTPDWLARTMVREVVTDPLNQEVLDPACGSGTFVAEAVTHFIEAAEDSPLETARERLEWLRVHVAGIDVHPVAVHLARAAWVLAAQPAIQAAVDEGFQSSITVPIYLGDALQLRYRTGDMFAEQDVTIQVNDEQNTELVFPVSLVDRAEDFDALMGDVSESIEKGEHPFMYLDRDGALSETEREIMEKTIDTLQKLHNEGRNHIWAYYTRNLVRPVALSRSKVDVVIGNPPWLNYNQTASTLRTELERQSKDLYGIWQGGRYASNQDVAGLFFARCVDLYLKDGGVIGFVMPHSALQTGQYAKWRTGTWRPRRYLPDFTVKFDFKAAWDLEGLKPNDFFPVPASVVFAQRTDKIGDATPLAGKVERWLGKPGLETDRSARITISDTSAKGYSPYGDHSRQGAAIRPRRLIFIEETVNPAVIQAGQTVTVNPRLGPHDKNPWRSLNLTEITEQTIEKSHVFDVYLGETVAPYVTLAPLKAVLPLKKGEWQISIDENGVSRVQPSSLEWRMRDRWRTVSRFWDEHKQSHNKLDLLANLDHYGKLSSQLAWKKNAGVRPIRLVYTEAGRPTASLLQEKDSMVDETLYWVTCNDIEEAYYLLAIINSDALAIAVNKFTTANWAGNTRHLHKHLWKLPIPEFDPDDPLHVEISDAGKAAATGAAQRYAQLQKERGDNVSVTIVRRELRAWLRTSPEGGAVEGEVGRLLA